MKTNLAQAEEKCRLSSLRINLLSEPFGVKRDRLVFSWETESPFQNVIQQDYRIQVAKSKEELAAGRFVFDSGIVSSAQSAGVFCPKLGEALSENAAYALQVITHDTEGVEYRSEERLFTTAVENAWCDTRGIWAAREEGFTCPCDFLLEAEISVEKGALGLVFRASDPRNFYFWQFRADAEGRLFLIPHRCRGGRSAALPVEKILLPEVFLGERFVIRLECRKDTTKTLLVTKGGECLLDERSLEVPFGGGLGFRTGKKEKGKAYALRISDLQGKELYRSDFSKGADPFFGCKTEEGVLLVPSGRTGGDLAFLPKADDPYAFFRSEFTLGSDRLSRLAAAVLSVTATSPEATRQFVYHAYLNGQLVSIGPPRLGKAPGGEEVLFYNGIELSAFLKEGKNCLGALCYATEEKAFLCQLTLFYTDGSAELILNSARDRDRWQALSGNGVFRPSRSIGTHHFSAHGNNIDARVYPFGFAEAGFGAEGWKTPCLSHELCEGRSLQPSQVSPLLAFEGEEVTESTFLENGDLVIDLGGEIIGGVRLQAFLPSEASVTLSYGEQLNEDGSVRCPMLTRNVYKEDWVLPAGECCVESIDLFAWRYLSLSGLPEGARVSVRGLEIRTAFEEEDSFLETDHPLLADLYRLTRRTVKMTTQDLYVDSQSRERLSYEGDLAVNLPAAYAFSRDHSVGRFSCEYLYTHPTWPAEYRLLTAFFAMEDYLATGDPSSVKEYYPVLRECTFLNCLDQDAGLLDLGNKKGAILVDWPLSERDGFETEVDFNTVLNAVAVFCYEKLAALARLAGEEKDAEELFRLAASMRRRMIDRFYDRGRGAFRDGAYKDGRLSDHFSQHATAYALACGIYADEAMADAMAGFLAEQGKIRMSVYGAFFLLKGLYESGHGSLANALLLDPSTEEGERTWAYMCYVLKATLTTECWNPELKPNMTFSHPWGAAPACAVANGIFGLRPAEAGFTAFELKFCPDGIGKASIRIPTVKGTVEASFDTNGGFSATVRIPANSRARLVFPAKEGGRLLVNGSRREALWEKGTCALSLGSGTYQFRLL